MHIYVQLMQTIHASTHHRVFSYINLTLYNYSKNACGTSYLCNSLLSNAPETRTASSVVTHAGLWLPYLHIVTWCSLGKSPTSGCLSEMWVVHTIAFVRSKMCQPAYQLEFKISRNKYRSVNKKGGMFLDVHPHRMSSCTAKSLGWISIFDVETFDLIWFDKWVENNCSSKVSPLGVPQAWLMHVMMAIFKKQYCAIMIPKEGPSDGCCGSCHECLWRISSPTSL